MQRKRAALAAERADRRTSASTDMPSRDACTGRWRGTAGSLPWRPSDDRRAEDAHRGSREPRKGNLPATGYRIWAPGRNRAMRDAPKANASRWQHLIASRRA